MTGTSMPLFLSPGLRQQRLASAKRFFAIKRLQKFSLSSNKNNS
jgi:hypothetical protein